MVFSGRRLGGSYVDMASDVDSGCWMDVDAMDVDIDAMMGLNLECGLSCFWIMMMGEIFFDEARCYGCYADVGARIQGIHSDCTHTYIHIFQRSAGSRLMIRSAMNAVVLSSRHQIPSSESLEFPSGRRGAYVEVDAIRCMRDLRWDCDPPCVWMIRG
ncbi:hypothetical protein M422DRAFT_776818 [Sphaerobolus stellatus SS14]|nr:hypothetical protein M422DRAFT_776818 [Sphaerobolus stellatus SS14]